MRFPAVCAPVPAWFILKDAAVIVVFWNHAESALLILAADSCSMLIFLVLKALYKIIVPVIELAVLKFTLKEQSLVNKYVNLCG